MKGCGKKNKYLSNENFIPRKNIPQDSRWNTNIPAAKLLQSWPALCDPIDGSPPGSAGPGILQARALDWAAIQPFLNIQKWKETITHSV